MVGCTIYVLNLRDKAFTHNTYSWAVFDNDFHLRIAIFVCWIIELLEKACDLIEVALMLALNIMRIHNNTYGGDFNCYDEKYDDFESALWCVAA